MSQPPYNDPFNSVPELRRRKAHKKVKTGCSACKQRRQKCGEQKPACVSCIRHATDCLYDSPDKSPHKTPQATRPPRSSITNSRSSQETLSRTLLASPAPDVLNLKDLQLLHHYMTSTSHVVGQLPDAAAQAQLVVPQLAQAYPFVMRLILAKAAIHLSWLTPAERSHYILLAARQHRAAFPEFRSALQNMSQENHRAVIIYSKGLVWCSFAWFEPFSEQTRSTITASSVDWLPPWLPLLRGSCIVVDSCKQWIQGGLYLAPPPLDDVTAFLGTPDSIRVLELKAQMMEANAPPECIEAVSNLHEAFARASMKFQNTPLRNAMNFWAGSLSDDYLGLVHHAEPWSLIVMAHFCVLVSRSETRWFMKGHAVQLLSRITDRLDQAWLKLIDWPREQVGFEPLEVPTPTVPF